MLDLRPSLDGYFGCPYNDLVLRKDSNDCLDLTTLIYTQFQSPPKKIIDISDAISVRANTSGAKGYPFDIIYPNETYSVVSINMLCHSVYESPINYADMEYEIPSGLQFLLPVFQTVDSARIREEWLHCLRIAMRFHRNGRLSEMSRPRWYADQNN